jgi:hypothetical protein
MHKLVTVIRLIANRYPRLAWLLADIIRRFPRLNESLADRYGIRLPTPPRTGDAPAGYRFPLATTTAQLAARGRAILNDIER